MTGFWLLWMMWPSLVFADRVETNLLGMYHTHKDCEAVTTAVETGGAKNPNVTLSCEYVPMDAYRPKEG